MARKAPQNVTIIVDVDGDLLTYNDKELTGRKHLVAQVYSACVKENKVALTVYGPFVTANIDDPDDHMGITAALLSVSPQARVVQAPSEVWKIVQTSEI